MLGSPLTPPSPPMLGERVRVRGLMGVKTNMGPLMRGNKIPGFHVWRPEDCGILDRLIDFGKLDDL
jgi:hypothetical protein